MPLAVLAQALEGAAVTVLLVPVLLLVELEMRLLLLEDLLQESEEVRPVQEEAAPLDKLEQESVLVVRVRERAALMEEAELVLEEMQRVSEEAAQPEMLELE